MSPETVAKRGSFYYDNVIFRTEDTLHRVPTYGFEKWSNSLFPDMFDLPQGEKTEGRSDENPIHLPCSTFEFESLLMAMYPLNPGIYSLSKERWVAALKLSNSWDMPKIRRMAISQLEMVNLTLVEKITFGKECNVYEWLKDGYTKLVEDPSQCPLEELATLGWESVAKILWVAVQPSTKGIPLTAVKKLNAQSISVSTMDLSCQVCDKASIGTWNTKYKDTPFYCTNCTDNRSKVKFKLRVDDKMNIDKVIDHKVRSVFKEELLEAKSYERFSADVIGSSLFN